MLTVVKKIAPIPFLAGAVSGKCRPYRSVTCENKSRSSCKEKLYSKNPSVDREGVVGKKNADQPPRCLCIWGHLEAT